MSNLTLCTRNNRYEEVLPSIIGRILSESSKEALQSNVNSSIPRVYLKYPPCKIFTFTRSLIKIQERISLALVAGNLGLSDMTITIKFSAHCLARDYRTKVENVALTSMMGLEAKTFSSTLASLAEPLTVAKYRMAYLAETVFPAPDSPLTMMD